MLSKRGIGLLFLGAASLTVYLTQLGNPLAGGHSDEPLYIGIAIEMMRRHEWILPYFHGSPAFYKPPLVYWMMIFSFKIFGVSLFAARFPIALCGAATAVTTTLLGEQLFDERAGRLSGWLIATTIPGIYAFSRGALMDVPLIFFIALSLYFAVRGAKEQSSSLLALSFVLIGCCSLAKGPVGSLIPLLPLGFILYRTKTFHLLWNTMTLLGMLIGLDIFLFWPMAVTLRGYGNLWLHFFVIQENFGKFTSQLDPTTHATPGSVIWIHLLSQFLPWSFFFLAASGLCLLKKKSRTTSAFFLFVWILTVVVIFLVPQKKLSHYALPAIVPSALLVAGLLGPLSKETLIRVAFKLTGILFALCGLLLLLLVRVSEGTQNQMTLIFSSIAFLLAAYWSLKLRLEPAVYAVAAFLFFYALGLPRMMSTLDVGKLKPLVQNQETYAYHLDLSILGVDLQHDIHLISNPSEAANRNGILIMRNADRVDFLKWNIPVSPPLLSWDNWKDHIRMLDILQAAISGKPQLIHETFIAARLQN